MLVLPHDRFLSHVPKTGPGRLPKAKSSKAPSAAWAELDGAHLFVSKLRWSGSNRFKKRTYRMHMTPFLGEAFYIKHQEKNKTGFRGMPFLTQRALVRAQSESLWFRRSMTSSLQKQASLQSDLAPGENDAGVACSQLDGKRRLSSQRSLDFSRCF